MQHINTISRSIDALHKRTFTFGGDKKERLEWSGTVRLKTRLNRAVNGKEDRRGTIGLEGKSSRE